MKNYEIMFILKPADDAKIEEGVNKVKEVITSNGGVIEKVDIWGKKRLAYEIQDLAEGFYVLITFQADRNEAIAETDRKLRIDEDYLRHMIIRKD